MSSQEQKNAWAPASRDERPPPAQSAEEEEKLILAYTAKYPCPSYDEIVREMERAMSEKPEHAGHIFMWMAEFGHANYELCKRVYANPYDTEATKAAGQSIYDRGGHTAMQANYYVMKNFMCRGALRCFLGGFIWHGVGEWRA